MDQEIKHILLQELPDLLEHNPQVRESIWRMLVPYFAPRQETESRFDRVLGEIQRMREESERKWNEGQAELRQMREESERKWNENQATLNRMFTEISRVDKRIDSKIGAIGARWGIDSETAFRNGLRGILEEVAQVQVLHINEFDDAGLVFGQPDQVELDIVIRNGVLMICEIKSSVSKGDVAIFERKVQFYEQRHQRSVSHKVIISPMVDPRALPLVQRLGMHVYHNAEDVILDEGDAGAEASHQHTTATINGEQ